MWKRMKDAKGRGELKINYKNEYISAPLLNRRFQKNLAEYFYFLIFF